MPPIVTNIEQWSYLCRRCRRTWSTQYQARTAVCTDGTEMVTWWRNGQPSSPPWAGQICPYCGGLRVDRLPQTHAPAPGAVPVGEGERG